MNGRLESTWFRADTIFSGERIVKKKDFLEVISTLKPSGYQIEIALNKFMMENRKKVVKLKKQLKTKQRISIYAKTKTQKTRPVLLVFTSDGFSVSVLPISSNRPIRTSVLLTQ